MKRAPLIFLLLLFQLPSNAQVHVGPGQPYATIYAVCMAKAAHPGDTIYMHAGNYTDHGQVFDSLIGTPSQWILVRPYRDDSVSIHVQYTFQHAQYLKLYGLNFYGNDTAQSANVFHQLFFDYAYECFTANHDIIVDNCKFTDLNNTGKGNTGAMLKLDGTDRWQVSNCLFKDGTNITDGISSNANINGLVSNCTFENMPGDGSHCKGGSKNIIYEQNLFINCSVTGLDVGGDTDTLDFCPLGAMWEADNISVFSNIFIGGNTGVKLSSCHNSSIFNNTCFKTNDFAFRSLNASSNPIYLDNNFVYNNIFTTGSPYGIYMNASAGYNYSTEYFKNNLFHDYLHADPASINWSEMPGVNVVGSIIGDPLFKDTLNGDFSLKPGSPAIATGYAVAAPALDYYGNNFKPSRSIGAVEYAGAAAVTGYEDADLITLYPNPSHGRFTVSWSGAGSIKSVIIYNVMGQVVLSATSQSFNLPLNLSGMPEGVYRVVLLTGKGKVYTRPLVLE